jgi:hypothetical protein
LYHDARFLPCARRAAAYQLGMRCGAFMSPWSSLAVVSSTIAIAALACGGCGSSSQTPNAPDMTAPAGPLACGDYVQCLNNAADAQASAECDRRATVRARVLFQALNDCISNECASDAGLAAGSCGSFDQCLYCVQSGRSLSGRTNNGCSNDQAGTTMVSDPKCGRCVDPVVTCFSDFP